MYAVGVTLLQNGSPERHSQNGREFRGTKRTSFWSVFDNNARALPKVLIAAIEQLRPPAESTGDLLGQALDYHILSDFYVDGNPVSYVLTRYNIAEAAYDWNRRKTVSALARHLEAQEELTNHTRMKS